MAGEPAAEEKPKLIGCPTSPVLITLRCCISSVDPCLVSVASLLPCQTLNSDAKKRKKNFIFSFLFCPD